MKEKDFKIRLFGYETEGGRSSKLWTKEPYFFYNLSGQAADQTDEAYDEWAKTKRGIPGDEICTGMWKKIGDHGFSLVARFFPDGTFIEHNIASEQDIVRGTWEQFGPMIKTEVKQTEEGKVVVYELALAANKIGIVHSAVELRDGVANAYFRMIHLL